MLELFPDPASFRARAEAFLADAEAENNLIYGIVSAIEQGSHERYVLGVSHTDGAIDGVVVMTYPYNAVLSTMDPDTAVAIADALLDLGIEVPGISGPDAAPRAFARRWSERTGTRPTLAMPQRIYRLRELREVPTVPGAMRPATALDRDVLAAWLAAFEAEALGGAADPAAARQRTDWFLTTQGAGVALWEDGGPASMAAYSGPTPNGIRVSAVYTPPERRRRGYAGACVGALSALLLERYRFCFLYTDLDNPTSNSVYIRLGYEPVCDADVWRFDPEPP